jgi:undecaprenyl diphosphate synthase
LNYKKLLPEVDLQNLPNHIGIIMDGNGRWAAKDIDPVFLDIELELVQFVK